MKRGDLYTARLDPVEGSEQRGTRPVLIVSNDAFNDAMPIVTIVPLTTYRERRIRPAEFVLLKQDTGLAADSVIRAYQVRTLSKSRLGTRIGAIDESAQRKVNLALSAHLDL